MDIRTLRYFKLEIVSGLCQYSPRYLTKKCRNLNNYRQDSISKNLICKTVAKIEYWNALLPVSITNMNNHEDYGRLVRKSPSLHCWKSTPTPKFLGTAKAYFVCHISPNFQIFLICTYLHWVSLVRDSTQWHQILSWVVKLWLSAIFNIPQIIFVLRL